MPREAAERGAAEVVLPLDQISRLLLRETRRRRAS
jgi:chemotaxis response regulator CheB